MIGLNCGLGAAERGEASGCRSTTEARGLFYSTQRDAKAKRLERWDNDPNGLYHALVRGGEFCEDDWRESARAETQSTRMPRGGHMHTVEEQRKNRSLCTGREVGRARR